MRQVLLQFIQRRIVSGLEPLDLDAFLAETEWLRMPVVERLRVLAHVIEQRAQSEQPEDQFTALRPLYIRALQDSPHDPWLWHAWGERASALAARTEARSAARWMWGEAERSLERATRLAPGHPDLLFAYAKALYDDPERAARMALPWFERVLAFSPGHRSARLFLGHCLQQLERWEEAIAAYEALLQEPGAGASLISVQANWANCLQQLGQRDRADAAYSEILRTLDQLPPEHCDEALASLESVGAFPPQLVEHWESMVERVWNASVV
jgi:tetratricopeptide (TPR) repeat protein